MVNSFYWKIAVSKRFKWNTRKTSRLDKIEELDYLVSTRKRQQQLRKNLVSWRKSCRLIKQIASIKSSCFIELKLKSKGST